MVPDSRHVEKDNEVDQLSSRYIILRSLDEVGHNPSLYLDLEY